MGYIKAVEALPAELVSEIQKYVDGEMLYIPRKCEEHSNWGEKSGIREKLEKRDRKIFDEYASGKTMRDLSKEYYEPGDRASDCGGYMDPVAVWVRKNGEWAIIHRCRQCGQMSSNRVAADDNPMKLMSIALKPLTAPPFPIERIREMTEMMGGDGACY